MSKNKIEPINSIRGMHDVLPADSGAWLALEARFHALFSCFGYRQIRMPIVEETRLFSRSIGAETDIVSKEMYSFDDREGINLTLRPEGTASCVRAGIQNGLFYNQQQRLWYNGAMFRHERPQKGRYRQFHQVGVEAYGWYEADIEAEVLAMVVQLFNELGLKKWRLEINSLGNSDTRERYTQSLIEYLNANKSRLDDHSLRRLTTNPLRILDSKNPEVQELVAGAPSILDFLTEESEQHFTQLRSFLDALKIDYTVNPTMVRGLDYYNDTVFEFICDDFGAQATVCGGGRYDGLVEQLGGVATPAFGFGLGIERLLQILEEQGNPVVAAATQSVFVVSESTVARSEALLVQKELIASGIQCVLAMGNASLKNQFKKADKSGADVAIVIAEREIADKSLTIKPLRKIQLSDEAIEQHQLSEGFKSYTDGEQRQYSVPRSELINEVTNLLNWI